MTAYIDKFTGKQFDKLSDRFPKQIEEMCENGHDSHLIKNCIQCGAPVCCPVCCDEYIEHIKAIKNENSTTTV